MYICTAYEIYMTDKATVQSFLHKLKQIINIWDIVFVNRPKNSIQHLADLGITANSRKEIIFQLEIEDYNKGPLPETQYNGNDMWVFGRFVKKQEVYIKLTIIEETGKTICISFHKAEHPMEYPFKEN